MDLVYLSFLVTFASCLEDKATRLAYNIYLATQTRLPFFCDPYILKLQKVISSTYTHLRNAVCKTADGILTYLDNKIDDCVEWSEEKFPGMCEQCKSVRKFWMAMGAHVSEAWQQHGVLLGTFVIFGALLFAIFSLLWNIWRYPFVQKRVRAVENSDALKFAKAYYQQNIEQTVAQTSTTLKNAIQTTGDTVSGTVEFVRDLMIAAVETLVRSKSYKRVYWIMTGLLVWLKSLETVQFIVSHLSPFFSPLWNKISNTEVCQFLVTTFTPPKSE